MKPAAEENVNEQIFVVTFFIDGEIVYVSAYRKLEDAHRDREVWITAPLIRKQFSRKYESMSESEVAHDIASIASRGKTFRDTEVYGAEIRESSQWIDLQQVETPLDVSVLSWLRNYKIWCYTNVLASLFGIALADIAKCVEGLAAAGSIQLGSSFKSADGAIIYEVSAILD